MKNNFISTLIKVTSLCIIIFVVTSYFIYNYKLIGFVVFLLGILCLIFPLFFKTSLNTIWPDIVFGIIDNGILAIFAVFGGEIAGVMGAIIGGVVGNAITDGIAGIFEGYISEKMRNKNISDGRTMLGSSVGKMAGCLLSAGFVLVVANLFNI